VLVMKIRKQVLGEEHPDSLTSMANLALCTSTQDRWKEAEDMQVQVMEITKQVLGEGPPDTLRSMENLVFTNHNQGRRKKAVELQVLVMKMRNRMFGEEHRDSLAGMPGIYIPGVGPAEGGGGVAGAGHENLPEHGTLASAYENQGQLQGGAAGDED